MMMKRSAFRRMMMHRDQVERMKLFGLMMTNVILPN